jgi:hypothetical protein
MKRWGRYLVCGGWVVSALAGCGDDRVITFDAGAGGSGGAAGTGTVGGSGGTGAGGTIGLPNVGGSAAIGGTGGVAGSGALLDAGPAEAGDARLPDAGDAG